MLVTSFHEPEWRLDLEDSAQEYLTKKTQPDTHDRLAKL